MIVASLPTIRATLIIATREAMVTTTMIVRMLRKGGEICREICGMRKVMRVGKTTFISEK